MPSGSLHSSDCHGHDFVFNPSCFRKDRIKGQRGESPGRLTVAFRVSCRAGWTVTTEGAALTWATDTKVNQTE